MQWHHAPSGIAGKAHRTPANLTMLPMPQDDLSHLPPINNPRHPHAFAHPDALDDRSGGVALVEAHGYGEAGLTEWMKQREGGCASRVRTLRSLQRAFAPDGSIPVIRFGVGTRPRGTSHLRRSIDILAHQREEEENAGHSVLSKSAFHDSHARVTAPVPGNRSRSSSLGSRPSISNAQ